MIKSVGIDLAGSGEHKVRCLDEKAELCDGFCFETTPAGLKKLEERIFRDGANPTVVFEPTGLAWLAVAVYLRARHPIPPCGIIILHYITPLPVVKG